jgi:hypothetical protein
MRRALELHPDTPCEAVTGIEVDVARPSPGILELHYYLRGRVGDLALPPVAAPARRDGLWQHSCFEAFLRSQRGGAYYEFNFAPTTEWAAYRLGGYRSGMHPADMIPPWLEAGGNGQSYELRASLALESLPDLAPDSIWQLGLSAVIEEASGRKSYWALAHPPGDPDFHHPACFALELPPAASS